VVYGRGGVRVVKGSRDGGGRLDGNGCGMDEGGKKGGKKGVLGGGGMKEKDRRRGGSAGVAARSPRLVSSMGGWRDHQHWPFCSQRTRLLYSTGLIYSLLTHIILNQFIRIRQTEVKKKEARKIEKRIRKDNHSD